MYPLFIKDDITLVTLNCRHIKVIFKKNRDTLVTTEYKQTG